MIFIHFNKINLKGLKEMFDCNVHECTQKVTLQGVPKISEWIKMPAFLKNLSENFLSHFQLFR